MRGVSKKVLAAVLAAGMLTSPAVPTAVALTPTEYNPDTDFPPPDEAPKPDAPMEQRVACAVSAVLPDSQFQSIPANNAFRVDELHRYADGTGQVIGVIDSGVAPNARLPKLRGGGDYITGGNGLSDCDHHGTLIAGIAAARPARNDSFVGVAPGAEIVSVRQTSSAFQPKASAREEDENGQPVKKGSPFDTLAKAIVRATNEGATVINMSVTACIPAGASIDLSRLRGALHYAAVERDVVVVASAGNLDGDCKDGNPGPIPNDPLDPRGWAQATTVSLPSYIDEFVLSVGGTTLTGDPYQASLPGPWVDVSAPAESIVSLDPNSGDQGGLINAEVTQNGPETLSGTSFASAYVSGLAALIRQRHPELNQEQVRNRIINSAMVSAQSMNNIYGYGPVDPVVALVGDVPTDKPLPVSARTQSSALKVPPREIEQTPWGAYIGIGVAVMMFVLVAGVGVYTVVRTGPGRTGGDKR